MKISEGHVAVVTGAASGIGFALAQHFVARGARVVLADVEVGALDAAVEALRSGGADVSGVLCDVTQLAQVEAVRDHAIATYGAIDVVCNNAGIFAGLAPMWELTKSDWEWNINVNLWGVIHGIMTFVPAMVERGSGLVINTASSAGISIPAFNAPYNAAKHAVVALTETLRAELDVFAPGVDTAVICPGRVATRVGESARNRPETLGPGTPNALGGAARHAGELSERDRTILASVHAPSPFAEEVPAAYDFVAAVMPELDAGRLHIAPGENVRHYARQRVERLLVDLTELGGRS